MIRAKMVRLAEKLVDKLQELADVKPVPSSEIAALREEVASLYQLNDLMYGGNAPLSVDDKKPRD